MIQKLEDLGYVNYEFSNFGKPSFFSVNNQNYWKGKPYLGIGPAAHSYDENSTIKMPSPTQKRKILLSIPFSAGTMSKVLILIGKTAPL